MGAARRAWVACALGALCSSGSWASPPVAVAGDRLCALSPVKPQANARAEAPRAAEDNRTFQGDIDGDGRPERLVARLLGVSNGLGVSSHEVCIRWPALGPTGAARPPVCREVSEWQSLTVLVRERGRPGCSLMDGSWQPGGEAGRGDGTYAVGQLLRLGASGWQPVPTQERAGVRRRLLNSFMAERERLPQHNARRLWYQHPAAQPVP